MTVQQLWNVFFVPTLFPLQVSLCWVLTNSFVPSHVWNSGHGDETCGLWILLEGSASATAS